MGHWSIDKDGEEDTDEIWGDQESDIVDDYFDYLLITDPKRFQNQDQLILDIKVLVWNVFYELEEGRAISTREVEYGIKFCSCQKDDYIQYYFEEHGSLPELHVPQKTPYISFIEVRDQIGLDPENGRLTSYLNYLKETDPERLEDREQLLEDTRLLTYDVFQELKGRTAENDELNYVLNASLDHI